MWGDGRLWFDVDDVDGVSSVLEDMFIDSSIFLLFNEKCHGHDSAHNIQMHAIFVFILRLCFRYHFVSMELIFRRNSY